MSVSERDRFERERWSLFLEFDPYEVQAQPGREMLNPLGDRAALEAFVLREFGGLPEELPEIWLDHEDGRIEISTGILDFQCKIMDWVCMHTIPRKMSLERNEDR